MIKYILRLRIGFKEKTSKMKGVTSNLFFHYDRVNLRQVGFYTRDTRLSYTSLYFLLNYD